MKKKTYPDTPMGAYDRGKAELLKLLRGLVIFYVAFLILAHWFYPRDSTDAPGERSGLSIYTDHRTGCQYLTVRGQGLAPRIDAQGRPICRNTENP